MQTRKTHAAKTELAKTGNFRAEEHEDDCAVSNDQQSQESLFSSDSEAANGNAAQRTGLSLPLAQHRLSSTDECESMDSSQNSSEEGRPKEKAWSGWTEEHLQVLREHLNYRLDVLGRLQQEIVRVNRAWANGPIDFVKQNPVKKPTNQLDFLMYKSKPKKKKTSEVDVANMNAEQFNEFLRQQRGNVEVNESSNAFNIQLSESLDSVAKKLKQKYQQLLTKENDLLNERIQLGIMLHDARKVFRRQRQAKSIRGTWNEWVATHTQICKSYANKCIAVAKLVEQYPVLRQLNICFTDLFKMLRQIKIVFAANPDIAAEWKTAP
jgi:hypothetical protein